MFVWLYTYMFLATCMFRYMFFPFVKSESESESEREREQTFVRPTEFAYNNRVKEPQTIPTTIITRVQIPFLFSSPVQRGLLLTSCRMAAMNTADVC